MKFGQNKKFEDVYPDMILLVGCFFIFDTKRTALFTPREVSITALSY